jgi:hypothetical protein
VTSENTCSLTDDYDCDGPKNNCSLTDEKDEDDESAPAKSTKGLGVTDVALLTQQLEHHLASELEN